VDDLALYARDLDAAATEVRAAGHAKLVVLGHSTGGLVGSLWAAARPGRADALVLNSPYLEVNRNWLVRGPVSRMIEILARFAPRAVVGGLTPYYGRALHISTGGEWDFTLAWKPSESFPARAGWVRSVRRSQRRVARGLGLQLPVLVLTSDRSGPHGRWHADLVTTDSVLNVQHIRERARHIGDDVTLVEVPGGAHDLALSRSPGREKYLSSVLDWLDDRLASTENPPPPR
jgi:alpha-beta hydrolase superfamily lysophospholipase